MTVSAREQLAVLLATVGGRGSFSASQTAPTDDLHLEVRGVGPLTFPVSEEQAVRLCSLGRPARYGQGEHTLLDPAVRNTWEIPRSRVKIDKREWDRTLLPVIEHLHRDLGLPDGRLEAELHSMLVYAPGQFFVRHQDSEKEDAMVGSLVVTLPSAFTGGAFEVEHQGQVATYRGSKKALSFVAFYSDCRHQIKPVRSGHRVVLTYNLMLRGDPALELRPPSEPGLVDDLAGYLERHFDGPEVWRRLVYLLDHEYTPRGLSWSRLKGVDAGRVSALRTAAERAGCEVALGLAEVHETWSAFEPERARSYRHWRYRDWEEFEEDDPAVDSRDRGPADDYDLDELIESTVTLGSWLGSAGEKVEEFGLSIKDGEVCASTPSGDMSPYASEYEGYMGNWGNTLDRWYHRGALVVWPTRLDFSVRAEASPSWALDTLSARVRAGDLAGARQEAGTLAPFWAQEAGRSAAKTFLTKVMRTARLLDEPSTAAMLLKPFRLEMLTPGHAKALSALVAGYGEQWAADLVQSWSTRRGRYDPHVPSTAAWIASLHPLCSALAGCGDPGMAAAGLLLRNSWSWLGEAIEKDLATASPLQRREALGDLGRPVAAVLEGASLVGAADLVDEAAAFLCREDDGMVGFATEVLRAVPAPKWSAAGLDAVSDHCRRVLEGCVARPPRPADDWSIRMPPGCSCELCGTLAGFLSDPARKIMEWPLAKAGRAHIHSRVSGADLPVSHVTRRKGSPYTLVLTKTAALFKQEEQDRQRDRADLAWIKRKRHV